MSLNKIRDRDPWIIADSFLQVLFGCKFKSSQLEVDDSLLLLLFFFVWRRQKTLFLCKNKKDAKKGNDIIGYREWGLYQSGESKFIEMSLRIRCSFLSQEPVLFHTHNTYLSTLHLIKKFYSLHTGIVNCCAERWAEQRQTSRGAERRWFHLSILIQLSSR